MQYYNAVLVVFTALFGLVFGSFLNVCIFRIPKGESIVFGRSHCMSCNKQIAAYDLIPVLSFIFLRGRCRYCGARLSLRYPLVESLNAALWVAGLFAFGFAPSTIIYMAFLSGLIVISFIDIDTMLIPNGLIIYLFIIGIVLCFFSDGMPFYENILGVVAGGAPLLIIMFASRGGMGGGDAEFAAAAGLLLGWKLSLFALFAAVVLGGIYGAFLLIFKHKSGKTQMPFAPFLAGGMTVALFFGNTLLGYYLTLIR